LDAIVNYVPRKPLAVLLTEALAEGGLSETITKYREWQADLLNKYAYVEAELNALGYRLLTSNRIDEAIEIFKLNVEANPQSANVYDSLGEAYRAAGQNELSLKNYLKALDLNPRNVNAQEMLKRLQAK
jgi:tetratricopeptide (TPR) repeat protein